ncbi:hypothetical protein J23TS9_14500 [Paenibacillus sp. J23TS9]|nr:hypothetical protein J23TS9_14500 [Paenibacillus sp. J23TS9]
MRRTLSILTAIFLFIGIFPLQVLADSDNGLTGSGTEVDPYIIMKLEQLNLVSNDLSAHYKLGADIDASETASWNNGDGFIPIGSDGNDSSPFTGVFDGQGHIISGLTINRPSSGFIGLFGTVGSGGVVRNVGSEGSSITGQLYVGGLVGRNDGTVSGSHVSGTVSGTTIVGGLVGDNEVGKVSQSYATGVVSGSGENVGGMVGYNFAGLVIQSNSFSDVKGRDGVGGLVGNNDQGSINQSYATGTVNGQDHIGGLVGIINNSGEVSQSYAIGAVSGSGDNVGGLVGYNNSGEVSQSYATGAVSGSGNNLGGLVGSNSGKLTSSFWDMDTTGQSNACEMNNGSCTATGLNIEQALTQTGYSGWDFTNDWFMVEGLTRPFLRSEYSTTLTNTHQLQLMAINQSENYTLAKNIDFAATFTDSTRSDMWATSTNGAIITGGGFAPIGGNGGSYFNGTFDGLGHTISNLIIHLPLSSDIGLFGYVQSNGVIKNIGLEDGSVTGNIAVGGLVGMSFGTVSNVYNTGNVIGEDSVGGLAGRNSNGGTISEAYSAGSVHGRSLIGGLVGENYAEVSDTYVTGSVNGNNEVGGLVGRNFATVSTSYATGAVSGNAYVGGLVGYSQIDTLVSASLYDSQTTGQSDTGKGEPRTTSEMKRESTFQPGWDLNDTWMIEEGKAYPTLQRIAANIGLDAAPPTIVSAKVEGDHPDTVIVTFDEEVNITNSGGFTIKADGIDAAIMNQSLTEPKVMTFTISNAFGNDQGITISYDGQLGNIVDASHNPLYSFANRIVENNAEVLEAPTNLTATADNSRITLNWNNVTKAGSYKIYMSTTSGDYSLEPIATVTEATYSVTDVTYGTTYYFAVKSSNEEEDSEYSNEVSATLLDYTPPSVSFGMNGSESWVISAETTVTVNSDPTDIGVDSSTLQYAWTTDSGTPVSGWTSFTNGDLLAISGVDGDWYLHIQASDEAGHRINVVSNRFRMDSSIASLSGLTVSTGTLSPVFAANTTSYTLSVGNSVSSMNVTPVAVDGTDTITLSINGGTSQNISSGERSKPLALNIGDNTITVHITALNGSQQTYIVTATRAAESTNTSSGGGSTSSSSSGGSIQPNSSYFISTDGRTITFDGGQIILPSGVLDRSFYLTLKEVFDTNTLPFSNTEQLISKVIELTKDQPENFNKEVILSLHFAVDKIKKEDVKISLYWLNEATNEWVELKNTLVDWEKGTVSGATDHFTKFAVIATPIKAVEQQPQVEGESGVHFTDIHGHWAEKSIQQLAGKGALSGYSDGTFKPDKPITRAEFAAILVRTLKLPQKEGKVFDDTAHHWASQTISTAYAYGIIQGYDQHTFAPNELITREQIAMMIVNALQLENEEASHIFADQGTISTWAQKAVAATVEQGVITGYPNNTVKPKAHATRAEVATIISRAIEKMKI